MLGLYKIIEDHKNQEDDKSRLIVELAQAVQESESRNRDQVSMLCRTLNDQVRYHIKTDRIAMTFVFLAICFFGGWFLLG